MCHSSPSAKRGSRLFAAHGLPVHQCGASSQKRKVGPWLRTALPRSPMLRQLTLVPYSKVWLGFRSSLPQKNPFVWHQKRIFSGPLKIFLLLTDKEYIIRIENPFHKPISSFIKTIPTLVGTSLLCIILHNNTKEYCTMEHKFSKIRSSLIAHRSSLIAHRKN